ncbi:hypothetical protein DB44_CL00030 [Candidatus Protochlamydia amoebophila]|uniref:Uncharacterized protein n=1 Tax=Candidatus Protochlamydia amoebophila TaxID=362787 RepID=A0A0C1JP21_9BACT|nr:hypothetical protein DB44_CL00030 [Candidatus Protochlamydia amoebophila]
MFCTSLKSNKKVYWIHLIAKNKLHFPKLEKANLCNLKLRDSSPNPIKLGFSSFE